MRADCMCELSPTIDIEYFMSLMFCIPRIALDNWASNGSCSPYTTVTVFACNGMINQD